MKIRRLGMLAFGLTLLASSSAFAQVRVEGRIYTPGVTIHSPPPAVAVPVPTPRVIVGAPPPVYTTPGYVQPGYGQPGYVQPPAYAPVPRYRHQGRQNPAWFSARTRDRMARIEADLRGNVAAGHVAPQALHEFNARRSQVEQSLYSVSVDGVVTPFERRQVRVLLDALEDLDERYEFNAGVSGHGWWHYHHE